MTLAHRVALLDRGVLQQLDAPAIIYNNPANLFVAGFIGSPPMNFLRGELKAGRFTAQGVAMTTAVRGDNPRTVLGVRPEDCRLATAGDAPISGEIYATELIGDHTLVTVKVGSDTITVKASKDFAGTMGAPVAIAADPAATFLFDEAGGARLR
jgi:multiple sugar transport system ATP-binding protein